MTACAAPANSPRRAGLLQARPSGVFNPRHAGVQSATRGRQGFAVRAVLRCSMSGAHRGQKYLMRTAVDNGEWRGISPRPPLRINFNKRRGCRGHVYRRTHDHGSGDLSSPAVSCRPLLRRLDLFRICPRPVSDGGRLGIGLRVVVGAAVAGQGVDRRAVDSTAMVQGEADGRAGIYGSVGLCRRGLLGVLFGANGLKLSCRFSEKIIHRQTP
jgi:hypothetical protein